MSAERDGGWTVEERERLDARAWLCPRRIIEDGTWARIWSLGGARGACSSVLPVLTLHSWPKRGGDRGWSEWAYLGRRRLARLAGVTTDTATRALRALGDAGLVDTAREPQPKGRGGYRTRIRVAARLFARRGEESGSIGGDVIGGGAWHVLPSPAARHLYVVIAAMDSIGDESRYLQRVLDDCEDFEGNPPWDEYGDVQPDAARGAWLDEQRARHPMTLSALCRWSGLSRRSVLTALQQLLCSRDPDTSLIRSGVCTDGIASWYAVQRLTWWWNLDFLNDPARIAATRDKLWG